MKPSVSNPGFPMKTLPASSSTGIGKKLCRSTGNVEMITKPSTSGVWKTLSGTLGSGIQQNRDENWNVMDPEEMEVDSENEILETILTDDEEVDDVEGVEFGFPAEDEGLPKLYQDPYAAQRVFDALIKMMRPVDIKKARRVCGTWFNLITGSAEFWKRFKILQVRNDGVRDWSELLSSDLVSRFHATEFHFMQSDLTLVDANLFLAQKAPMIKHLSLEHCTLSPATLQLIFSEFLNLESLNLNGLSPCVVFCESLFPSPRKRSRLQKLKSIKLCSNFGETWARDPLHWNVTSMNLQRNFLAEVLTASSVLEALTISGWGSKTCSHVIEILLCHQRRFLHLSQLHFLNIPQRGLNFEHFHLFSSPYAAEIFGLSKFSLTLFTPLSLEHAHIHAGYANVVVRNILKAFSGTLQVLALDRCPVTSRIFTTEMPKLRTLFLKSTQVAKANFGHLVPALTVFKHSRHHMNFNPQWESRPPLFMDTDNVVTGWGEDSRNTLMGGDELTMDDLRRQGQNVRRGETNMWKPLAIILILLLPPAYIYLTNAFPEYDRMIFLLMGVVALVVLTGVRGYL